MKKTVFGSLLKRSGLALAVVCAFLFFGCGAAPVRVTVDPTSATIEKGATLRITASASDGSALTWSSSDEAVASVAQDGTVTGVAAGKATVTAAGGGALAVCAVTVTAETPDGPDEPDVPDIPDGPDDARTLVWSDEFDGNALDLSKWSCQIGTQDRYGSSTGPQYWGNNEQQYYTSEAVGVADGALKITAKRQAKGDRLFTSARLITRDKASWTYGYFEAKMKTPALKGMWPAFWMLPQPSTPADAGNKYGTWAANGEIDIMEAKGRLKNSVDTTLHFGGNWPQNTYRTRATSMTTSTEEWHVYALEWRENYMTWYIDDAPVYTLTNDDWYSTAAPENKNAPFDQPFYILLDLAVGGNYDGGVMPDADFTSASMYVDYVRVYAYE